MVVSPDNDITYQKSVELNSRAKLKRTEIDFAKCGWCRTVKLYGADFDIGPVPTSKDSHVRVKKVAATGPARR